MAVASAACPAVASSARLRQHDHTFRWRRIAAVRRTAANAARSALPLRVYTLTLLACRPLACRARRAMPLTISFDLPSARGRAFPRRRRCRVVRRRWAVPRKGSHHLYITTLQRTRAHALNPRLECHPVLLLAYT